MSTRALRYALDLEADITVFEHALMIAIADVMNDGGNACVPQERIAQRSGVSKNLVPTLLVSLKEKGLLVWTMQPQKRGAAVNLYSFPKFTPESAAQ